VHPLSISALDEQDCDALLTIRCITCMSRSYRHWIVQTLPRSARRAIAWNGRRRRVQWSDQFPWGARERSWGSGAGPLQSFRSCDRRPPSPARPLADLSCGDPETPRGSSRGSEAASCRDLKHSRFRSCEEYSHGLAIRGHLRKAAGAAVRRAPLRSGGAAGRWATAPARSEREFSRFEPSLDPGESPSERGDPGPIAPLHRSRLRPYTLQ
jgi:hypothetical protein